MDLVVELVKDRLDNYSTSENIIRSKTDLLITIGTEIIPDINSTRVSTTLLRSLRNFFYGEYTILISISLSLQAEILSEQCEDDYLLVVQQFMRIIDYDKAKYIHKDG